MNMKKFLKTTTLSLMMGFVTCSPAWATKYLTWDSEDQVCNAKVPENPPWWHGTTNRPATTFCDSSAAQGSKYFGWKTADYWHDCLVWIHKREGLQVPLSVQMGKTYYLAYYERFDRINSRDIWHEGKGVQSADKGVEIRGNGIRWTNSRGQWSGAWAANQDHRYTMWMGNPNYHLNPEEVGTFVQNQSGYSASSPVQLEYDKWHAVVVGYKMATDNTGSITMWVDGTKILEHRNIKTVASSSATIDLIMFGGTMAQPAYDSPAHYRKFDSLLLTDDWQDILNGGYLGAAATPIDLPPAAPGNLRITGSN